MDLAEQAGAVTPQGVVGSFQPAVVPLLHLIGELFEDPDNVRLHPDENLEALRNSLLAFGQTKPIVFRREGAWPEVNDGGPGDLIVVAGNGTLRVARELGWTHIAAVEFSGDARLAKAYAIADNRVPELAAWDHPKLDAQLAELDQGWLAESLDWQAEEPASDRESAEADASDREDDLDDKPAPKVDGPKQCDACRSVETVCANCVTNQIVAPLLALRAALAPDQFEAVGKECWLQPDQVKAVVEAILRRAPQETT